MAVNGFREWIETRFYIGKLKQESNVELYRDSGVFGFFAKARSYQHFSPLVPTLRRGNAWAVYC